MRKLSSLMVGMVVLGSVVWADDNGMLVPNQVFSYSEPAPHWQEMYAQIPGHSLEEKENHARTTLEIKAVSEMRLYAKEKELSELGKKLWEALPEELAGMEDRPRDRFLKTHLAWRKYIVQQASFIANTSGGGSMYTLLARNVLIDELSWRIQLYQELFDGKNAVKHSLYFYPSKPSSGG